MLARALANELVHRGYTVAAPGKAQLDITDESAVHEAVRKLAPRTIIQCAAYTRVDDAESHESEAYRVNALGTKFVAEAARDVGARFVFPSTDYVFDGAATKPYEPESEPNPINAYGRTKLAGEVNARAAPDHLVIRTSWLYGPGGRNFVRTIMERLGGDKPVRVVNDQVGRPTWTIDAARAVADLVKHGDPGVYHWCNGGEASWYELATAIARLRGVGAVTPCFSDVVSTAAPRPRYSVLDVMRSEAVTGPPRDWRLALSEALESNAF